MIVTGLWIAWLVAIVGLWVLGGSRRDRVASLHSMIASVGTGRFGRLLPVLLWGWIGWHMFARYTLPR